MSANYVVGVRINGDASGLSKAAQEALRAQRLLAGGSIREYQRMASARSQLGVRSEREVRREMQQTEAAYNRLARSGTLSWREQRLAAKAMREEVTRLTNEMGRLTTRQKFAMGGKVVGALGTAAFGAGVILKPKLDRSMDYDKRLRVIANTGVDVGASQAEREKQRVAAGEAVITAIRYGGGDRDGALDAYNEMVGKGSTFTGKLPQELLPEIQKASTATMSAATDMSRIAAAGIQNFGMPKTAAAAKEWFNIGAIGAKLGGFEMKNQAQYLPEQMALGGNIGMSGKRDFASIVMLNQAAEKTAGTPEKAAVNVKQFLSDIGSQHFRKRAEQASGVNFTKYAVENRLKNNVGMVDSAMQLVDRTVEKHPAYQQLKKRLAETADPEKRDKITSAMKMVEGSVSSQFFHNQESAQVVAAYRANRELMKTGQEQALSGVDEVGSSYKFIQSSAQYSTNKLANEAAIAMQSTMDKLTPTIGEMADKLAGLMQQYPDYTTAIMGATGALGFLATAATAAAFMGMRGPGGGGGPLIPPRAPGAGPLPKPQGVLGAAAAGAGRASSMLSKLGTVGMIASLGYELFGTSAEEIAILKEAEHTKNHRGMGFDDPRLLTRPDGGAGGIDTERPMPKIMRDALRPGSLPPEIANLPSPELARVLGKRMKDKDVLAQLATPYIEQGGYRGAGFDDPRLLTRAPQSLAERLAGSADNKSSDRSGEITVSVNVSAAPGLNVQAEAKSKTPGLSVRSDAGRSMNGTGH